MPSVHTKRIICIFLVVLSRLAFADVFPPLGVWYGYLAEKPIRLCVEQGKAAYHYAGHASEIQLSFTDSKRWVESVKGKVTGHWDINSDSSPDRIAKEIYGNWGKPGVKYKPHSFHLYHLENTASACSSTGYRETLMSSEESGLSLPLPQAKPSVLATSKSAALLQGNGDLWYWSENKPQPRMIGKGYVRIALGSNHFLGIKADGSLWGWGSNLNGQLGSDEANGQSPISMGNGFIAIAATDNTSLAVRKDGTLWMWGGLMSDAKGNVQGSRIAKPTLIGKSFMSVSARLDFYAAMKSDGTLWMWGDNRDGQLGTGNNHETIPTLVGTDFAHVSVGYSHTAAIKKDGSLWTWGHGAWGKLGNGKEAEGSRLPIKIGDAFSQVFSGDSNTAAVKFDGTLWLWGGNRHGMFGNCSTELIVSKPALVGEGFTQVALGEDFLVALKPDGSAWTLGWPWEGDQIEMPQACRKLSKVVLGDGISNWEKPATGVLKAKLNMPPRPANILAIAAGGSHSAMVKSDGTLWTWGNNEYGQLATGDIDNRNQPQRVGEGYKKVAIDGRYTLALKNDESLLRWGVLPTTFPHGDFSRDLERALAPTKVAADTVVLLRSGYQAGRGLGLRGDGTILDWLYYWETPRPPKEFGRDIREIGASYFGSYAIRNDGTLWSLSQYPVSPPPKHVGNDFVNIAVGASHAYGIKVDGSLWAWGRNREYQLGDGTQTTRADPVRIGEGFVQVAIGRSHGIALASDGSVWTWGTNEVGVIGDGTTLTRSRPVKVGTGFAMVASGDYHILALKADGTLWAWGANEDGQLGDGKNKRRLSPTQVFPASSVITAAAAPESPTPKPIGPAVTAVRVGLYFSCVAFANGQYKCWGNNKDRQFKRDERLEVNPIPLVVEKWGKMSGLFVSDPMMKCVMVPENCHRVSSKRPYLKRASAIVLHEDFDTACAIKNGRIRCAQRDDGGDSRWVVDGIHDAVAFDYYAGHGCALQSDGRVKCWGDNQYGQLGNGTTFTDYTHYRSMATEVIGLYP